ncbi:MAG TPA: FliH/SctL family protein [Clostridia bacterium]|nr:FliH/SctL family protein [Clostridia bacterium]
MSNRIFKNYQINMGMPFQVKNPINAYNIKTINTLEHTKDEAVRDDEVPARTQDCEDILETAREEASAIIKEAELEGMRILEESQSILEEHKKGIEEEARKKGYEEGISEARRQYEDLMNEAEIIKEHAKAEYAEVLAGIEGEAVSLILDIAKKVIGEEVKLNKESVVIIVKQAIEKCTNKEEVKVRLSPDDCQYLSENMEELTSKVDGLGEIELKKDSTLKDGSCIVETPYGSIDGGIETKFNKIEEEFINAVGKE